jgi:ArsR family transcriptional regulator, cadmium/lead-responsive transcriptional repressor
MLMTTRQAVRLRAKLFRGFSDPSRLAIVEALREGPLTVGGIVRATGLSQSNASNHLACLRECGLVMATQRGRFVSYALSDVRIEQLLHLTDELLAGVARGIDACPRYEAVPSSEPSRRSEKDARGVPR